MAGDTIYLRGGTYSGRFGCGALGTTDRRLTIRAYPGERVRIDGPLTITGQYIDWIGTEHFDSAFTDRSTGGSGHRDGVTINGENNRLINCIIHDFGQGIKSSAVAGDVEFIGCIVYHCGWDSQLGHGTYPQNAGPGYKTFKDCILFDNFGYNFHVWGSAGEMNNFRLEGNTSFNAGIWGQGYWLNNIQVSGQAASNGHRIIDNMTYSGPGKYWGRNQIGYGTGNPVTNVQMTGNFFACEPVQGGDQMTMALINCVPDVMTSNTFCGRVENVGTVAGNTYNSAGQYGNRAFLRANPIDPNRANLTVYNQSQANRVSVDVSGIFANGDTIAARNVQDYWNDTQSLIVADGGIAIDMQAANRTVESPQGWTAPASTFPAFGAFVLERT